MNDKMLRISAVFAVIVLAVAYFCFRPSAPMENGNIQMTTVKKVVDGDTLRTIEGKKVRLIGINAPELAKPEKNQPAEMYSQEAYQCLKEWAEGKKVYLEYDKERKDQYGRDLCYVWTEIPQKISKETLCQYNMNAVLLNKGYARTYTFRPNVKYSALFHDIEKEARANKRGLWSQERRGNEEVTRGNQVK